MRTYVGDEAKRNHEISEEVGSAFSFETVVDDTPIVLKILDSDGKVIFLNFLIYCSYGL